MAGPVWLLSVDLQTKTATFTTGLADAAKQARASFQDIKSGANEMGGAVGFSTMEARHSVMMLGEEFGVHLPRSLTTFISNLSLVGPALEAAFPFLAIILGATLLIEKLAKLHEAGEKLTTDQVNFQTAANNAFNSLGDKLLQAQIKADELGKNHMAALKHQLELIDHQSLNELQHSFLELAKSMEPVMKDLEGHWYTFGEGADGAKHALDDFKTHYEYMLSMKDAKGATGLLHGTLDEAKKTLAMMDQLKASRTGDGQKGNYAAYEEAAKWLEKAGALSKVTGDYTQKTYDAQLNLVSALQDQVSAEGRIADIKKLEGQNATTSAHQDTNKEAAEAARKYNEAEDRAAREYLATFKHEQADLINVTREGTASRLEALQEAMDATAELYGRDNETYKQYATEYIRTWDEMSEKTLEAVGKQLDEEDKRKEEAGLKAAANQAKMGELEIAAERQHQALLDSAHRVSAQQRAAEEEHFAEEAFQNKMREYAQDVAALDKGDKDYENKLKQIQDKETQLVRQHENEIAAIKDKAQQDQNANLQRGLQQMENEFAQGFTQVIMGHQSFAKMMDGIGNQVASGMLQNALKSMMTLDMDKEKQAASAARTFFLAGAKFPFPTNLVMAPVLGALGFASVMAYEHGTDSVPGIGRGDVIPTMLSPGEGVVPGGVMDGLRNMARSGGFDRGPQYHVQAHFAPTIHALDSDGVDEVLTKHQDKFQRHFEKTLRSMNR